VCHVANSLRGRHPTGATPRGRGPPDALPRYTYSKSFRFSGLFQAISRRLLRARLSSQLIEASEDNLHFLRRFFEDHTNVRAILAGGIFRNASDGFSCSGRET
jgi:hypothetical protein